MTKATRGSSGTKSSNPSIDVKLQAYFWWNALFIVSTASTLLVLLGPFIFPKVGLYLVLPYVTFTLFKRDELRYGNPWPRFTRNFPAFSCLRHYLDLNFEPLNKALIEAEKKADAQFIFAFFPHGTNADFRILMDGVLHQALPNVADKTRVLAATILFRIPIVREFCLWSRVVDARKSVAEGLLEKKYSIIVLPGGMDEQILTEHGKEIIYLQKRKGFIKLAMRNGIPVVPVYVFGTSDHFATSGAFFKLRYWIMKNLKMCIPLTQGLAGSFCPLPVKTTICFGDPMMFETKTPGQPTDDELNTAHAAFVKATIQLFDTHKVKLGYGDRKLIVV